MIFAQAFLFWIALFEWFASSHRLLGLSWRGGRARGPVAAALPLLLLVSLRGRWLARAICLAVTAPLALAVQVGAASLRNRAPGARDRLFGGEHTRASVTRLDILMDEGFLPALHVEPAGGAQKAVVVLHGSGCDKSFYAWPLIDALLDAGCAVLLIDLDGHGDNPRPQRFPQILDDAHVSVAWLRQRYARVGMIGISLGGCIAARAAADGLAVDRLALLAAPPKLAFSRTDVAREVAALPQAELLYMLRDSTAGQLVRAWQTTGIRAAISTWDLIDALDLLGSLPRIGSPLLLIYGGRDAIVKPVLAGQVDMVKPENARLVLLHGASHLSLQVSPRTMAELREWFRSL